MQANPEYLEKLIRLLEESFDVTRTEETECKEKCDLCGKPVHLFVKISGRTIGLDCDCPETLFILLVAFDTERMKLTASSIGMVLEVKDVTIKEIELKPSKN
jgi:hypothetical protein